MDISGPLSTLANQGVLGAVVLVCFFAIWKLYQALQSSREELKQASDRRLEDVKVIGNAYNASITGMTESLKEVSRQSDGITSSMVSISKNVETLILLRQQEFGRRRS